MTVPLLQRWRVFPTPIYPLHSGTAVLQTALSFPESKNRRKEKKQQLVATESLCYYQADLMASAQATLSQRNLKACSLRLALPSTLILHENGAFQNCSSNRRKLKMPALRFSMEGKHLNFRKRWRHDNHVTSLTEFSSNTNKEMIVAFSKFFGVVWTGPKM